MHGALGTFFDGGLELLSIFESIFSLTVGGMCDGDR